MAVGVRGGLTLFDAFIQENGLKNSQTSHKWTTIWESTGPFVIKLGNLVHLVLLHNPCAEILKTLIFWLVAPRD